MKALDMNFPADGGMKQVEISFQNILPAPVLQCLWGLQNLVWERNAETLCTAPRAGG